MRKTITPAIIMAMRPCDDWTEARVLEWFDGRKRVNLTTLIEDASVSAPDRLWVALREDFFDKRTLRLIATDYAESVLHLFEAQFPDDPRPRESISSARDYAEAAARDAEAAARDAEAAARAALDAALDARAAGAAVAALAAARATRAAAWAAALEAALDARAAAGDAEAEAQCRYLVRLLADHGGVHPGGRLEVSR